GYFTQRLAEDGSQTEEPVEWRVEDFLTEEPARASVSIETAASSSVAGGIPQKGCAVLKCPSIFSTPTSLPTPTLTATSPALCMAAIRTTVCARKSCWESGGCAFSAHSATTTSRATT